MTIRNLTDFARRAGRSSTRDRGFTGGLGRSSWRGLVALPAAGLLSLTVAVPAGAEPPDIPNTDTARAQLGELTVAPEGPMDGYDRDKFPHWNEAPDGCNVREQVLERDGEDVQVGPDCYPDSGRWTSTYDGATWQKASDLDIDHIVPLAAAWRSGAAQWPQERRQAFANDLEGPQLIAVTDDVNQDKGDQAPDKWVPPAREYHCTYAKEWIGSKHKWGLTITEAEKGTLGDLLNAC